MNILLLNYEYPPVGAGGSIVSKNIVEGLSKKNNFVILTSKYGKMPFKEKKQNITIYRLPVLRQKKEKSRIIEMFLYVFFSFFFLLKIKLKHKIDVINIHFAIPTGFLIFWSKLLFKSKIILVLHGGDLPNEERQNFKKYYELLLPLIKKILNFADIIVAVNPLVYNQAKKLVSKKIYLIPNGVDTEKFIPINLKKEYDILFIGRFIPMKNPLLAVEAFLELKKLKHDSKMLMIGDGPLFDELIKKIGKNKDLEVMKWVDHNELPNLINKCKIYWSLQEGTNYGSLTLLESLSCGLPTIVTKAKYSNYFVKNNGFLVDYNPKEISKKTFEILNSKNYEEYSKNSIKIAKNYSLKKMLTKYEEFFNTSL